MMALGEHRVCVAIGNCPDPGAALGVRSGIRSALRTTADPARALGTGVPTGFTTLCAVIDRAASQLTYSTLGSASPAIAAPDLPHRILDSAEGCLAVVTLPPGATLLLTNSPLDTVVVELDDCTALTPDAAADHLIGRLTALRPGGAVAAVLYRQPPAPLTLTVPAEPASLAFLRGQLRLWFALAGIDPQSCADVLLAAGEAASNAAEHSVIGTPHAVDITVHLAVIAEQLRLTVSDNGCWKPVEPSPGHRGHGIRLIEALVDSVDLSTTDAGTRVEMLKELNP